MYHSSPISCVSSHGNRFYATAGYDNKVILWDTKTCKPLSVGFHDHLANQVSFSKCGKFLSSSSSDYTARIWKVPSMELISVLSHDDDVEGISFSPCSTKIATASRDRSVRVFSTTGSVIAKLSGHTNDVLTVEWIDNDTLVSCGDDSTLRYWRVSTQECTKVVDLGGMETDTLCIMSDGSIFSGNDNGELVGFSHEGDKVSSINAHASGVKRLIVHGDSLISLSYDRTFKVWAYCGVGLELVTSGETPKVVWPRSCAYLDNSKIGFVTFGDRVAIYDIDSHVWQTDNILNTPGINALLTCDNGLYTVGDSGEVCVDGLLVNQVPSLCNFLVKYKGRLYCGGQDGTVYDALTSEVIYTHSSPLNCAAVLGSGETQSLLVGTYTGEVVQLARVGSQTKLIHTHALHSNAIKDLCVNDKLLFTVCADHEVKLTEFIDDTLTAEVFCGAHEKIVNGCSLLGDYFVSISRDLTLRVWERGGDVVIHDTPHVNSIKCIATDNKSVICCGDYRGCVSLFDLSDSKFNLYKLSIHGISSVEYVESENLFIAASYDGVIHKVELSAKISLEANRND
ncbi:WD40 repeat domain-containing protein [Vibrio maritimus]